MSLIIKRARKLTRSPLDKYLPPKVIGEQPIHIADAAGRCDVDAEEEIARMRCGRLNFRNKGRYHYYWLPVE